MKTLSQTKTTHKIIRMTYGYDATFNEYYLILSETDKTALIVEIGRKVWDDHGMGSGKSIPDPTVRTGQPFRAYKRQYQGRTYYASKFGGSTVKHGYLWEGNADYFNSWD